MIQDPMVQIFSFVKSELHNSRLWDGSLLRTYDSRNVDVSLENQRSSSLLDQKLGLCQDFVFRDFWVVDSPTLPILEMLKL